MSTTVIINALELTEFAFKKLPNGEISFESVLKTAALLPDSKKIIVIGGEDFNHKGNFELVHPAGSYLIDLLKLFESESGDSENIFYFYGDTPLMDREIAMRMYDNHRQYFASYTFADGYPYGMAPEIIKKTVLRELIALAEKHEIQINRKSIFELIQKDINSFDIETEISKTDQRMLRVSLTADTLRNFNQLSRIMNAGGKDETSIVAILESEQQLLRAEPSFINVQITGGCFQTCSYCPYPQTGGDIRNRTDEMSIDQWRQILSKVKVFCDDAVFNISMWGEPSRHSQISKIIEELLNISRFRLLIETSGIGWDNEVLQKAAETANGRIDWIISMDAENKDVYSRLRGEGWEEVNKTAAFLQNLVPDNLYIQSVRMKEEEEYLEKFYRGWKERGYNVIIQKHDHFCGVLADRRVTDLSPVRRFPCWHLKRDLNILVNGTVPMCREDLLEKYLLGNIFNDDLDLIWQKGEELYLAHLGGSYPDLCRECDEYYTYNF